jgi:hypothetical protein
MTIYKFLYKDIRTMRYCETVTFTPAVINKFYQSGYINLYEIITTSFKDLSITTSVSKGKLYSMDKQLRCLNLHLGMSPQSLDLITSSLYKDYYKYTVPLLHYRNISNYIRTVETYDIYASIDYISSFKQKLAQAYNPDWDNKALRNPLRWEIK